MSHQNASFQSLRFVFVMMIVMSHFSYGGIQPFDAGGDCGVAFFFLLSGFSLSMGYGPKIGSGSFRFGQYLKRRLLKIFPLHLLCLACWIVAFRPAISWYLPLNALLLQSWIPVPGCYFSYNAVSWFLSSLLLCYLLFPLAYRMRGELLSGVVLIVCLTAYILVPSDRINALLYVWAPMRLMDFLLGMLLYRVHLRTQHVSIPRWTEPLLVLLLITALAVYPFADPKLRNAPLYWLVLLPLIYVFARQTGPVSRLLQNRILQWLGSLSMPVFLTHLIIFRILFQLFPSLHWSVMLALSFSIIVTASWIIEHLLLSKILSKK